MTTSQETPGRAGRREWIGLAVIALPCVLYAMDLTVLNLAVPSLTVDLAPSSAQLLWIVDIYGFLVAGSLMTMGTLGDRIGRRRLLMIGAAAFGGASVLAAFSRSAGMLIASRAILGVAGATLAPSTLSLIRNMFLDARQRTIAIGVWISSYSVGGAIGPLVGGALLEHFWWGSVFLLSAPVMVLLLILGPILLPEFRDPNAGRLDVVSAGQSLLAVLSVIFGVKRIAQDGFDVLSLAAVVTGVVLGVLFLRRQRTLADPLIDLRLFRAPGFSASLAIYTLATLTAFGIFVFIAQYLQLVLGLSPLRAGLWTMPFSLAFILGSTLTPMLTRRIPRVVLLGGGLFLAAGGFALMMLVTVTSGPVLITASIIVYSLGLAPVFTLATDLIVGTAPPEGAGVAAAISETGSELGGALGIALLGSIGTALYRMRMAGVADEAARNTLGGAVAAAKHLHGPAAAELLNAARDAFTASMRLAAGVSAAITLVAAFVAVAFLRDVR